VHSDLLLILVVAAALTFDFTNGFHDTANVVASSISTRAMSPRAAVALASLLNFAGAFISLQVAATIATGIVNAGQVTETVAFAALIGAIAWNLLTWVYGLPSSSSHALIGGVVGAMLAAVGSQGIKSHALITKVALPAVIAPTVTFLLAGVVIVAIYRLVGQKRPGVTTRAFRAGQVVSASLLALAHGTNDAQKTMGVISLALLAHGDFAAGHFHVPAWVVVAAASAIALGTYAGGWRIIRTLGTRIIKMDAAQGFAAEGAGAAVILASSHFGYPLSSTHVISGGVIGAGAAKRLSAVRWGVAGNIFAAWILTLPGAGAFGAGTYWLATKLGAGARGPLLISALAIGLLVTLVVTRRSRFAGEVSVAASPLERPAGASRA
jgi:inorganic phosphate transporter, PiT family